MSPRRDRRRHESTDPNAGVRRVRARDRRSLRRRPGRVRRDARRLVRVLPMTEPDGTASDRGYSRPRAAVRSTPPTATKHWSHPRSWCRSARPSSATTFVASTISTRCSSSEEIGCRSATRTSRSPPPKEPSKRGLAREDNPVGGWYGLKKGLRGRFANYVPPVMEILELAEVEHNARNNRMRAIASERRTGG